MLQAVAMVAIVIVIQVNQCRVDLSSSQIFSCGPSSKQTQIIEILKTCSYLCKHLSVCFSQAFLWEVNFRRIASQQPK